MKKNVTVALLLTISIYFNIWYTESRESNNSIYIFWLFSTLLLISFTQPLCLVPLTLSIIYYYPNICFTRDFYKVIRMFRECKNHDAVREHVQYFANSILHKHFNYIDNLYILETSKPCILVCNYCIDRLENIALFTMPVKTVFILHHSNKKFFGEYPDMIYKQDSGNFDSLKKQIIERNRQGYFVYIYVLTQDYSHLINEYSKGKERIFGRIQTGMFRISSETGIPIRPMWITRFRHNSLGRLKKTNFEIIVGDELKSSQDPLMYSGQALDFFRRCSSREWKNEN